MTILEALKKGESKKAHNFIFLVEDLDAERVLVAWSNYKATPVRDRELREGEDYRRVAAKIWPKVDFIKLSRDSGVPYGSVIEVFHRLRGAGLIYPDGTANADALSLVQARVAAHYRLGPK